MKSWHCFWLKYESSVLVSFDVRGQRDGHFPHWLWIIDSYFVQKQQDKVKTTLMIYLFLKNRQLCTSQDIYCVDYCDVFISCLLSFWRHPFTAEHPLVSKWCNATFQNQNLFCWRNKLSTKVTLQNSYIYTAKLIAIITYIYIYICVTLSH